MPTFSGLMNRKLGTKTEIKSLHSAAGFSASSQWWFMQSLETSGTLSTSPCPTTRLLTWNRLVNDVWRYHNLELATMHVQKLSQPQKIPFTKREAVVASLCILIDSQRKILQQLSQTKGMIAVSECENEELKPCQTYLTGLTRSVSACPFSETVTNGNWRDLILSPPHCAPAWA